jgi:hypothetical protein
MNLPTNLGTLSSKSSDNLRHSSISRSLDSSAWVLSLKPIKQSLRQPKYAPSTWNRPDLSVRRQTR